MPFKDAGRQSSRGNRRADARPVTPPPIMATSMRSICVPMIRFRRFLALMTSRPDARSGAFESRRHRFLVRAAAPAVALALLVAMIALSRDFGATWDERALQKLGELIGISTTAAYRAQSSSVPSS